MFLPLVRIGNMYYNTYFLTVVSRNIICSDTYDMKLFQILRDGTISPP